MKSLLSRKFILSTLALVFGGVAFLLGKVSSSDFLTFVVTILGCYHVANVVESSSSKKDI